MNIPFFDLSRQYNLIAERIENEVVKVMRSTQYIEGDAVRHFENLMSSYLGVKHVITCNSGTDALRITLQSVGVSEGDEVITSPFTFYATAEAIVQIGAIPVFVDIDKHSLNLNPENIEKRISNKTKAIIPVHIFGLPADMEDINRIAHDNELYVIEDACQAIGAQYHGRKAGTLGDAGCFSFYPTKNLGGFGDGGMITTDDDNIAVVARAYKSHGAGRIAAQAYGYLNHIDVSDFDNSIQSDNAMYDPCRYYNYLVGCNSRLDSIQAAVLSVKLEELDKYNERRIQISERYTEAFKDIETEVPQTGYIDRISCRHQYPLLVDDKEIFIKYMKDCGIGVGNFYPVPLHLQRVFSKLGYHRGDLPVSEAICPRSACLPVFPELTEAETDYIIERVHDYYSLKRGDQYAGYIHTSNS